MYLLSKQTCTRTFSLSLPIKRVANKKKIQVDVYLQIKMINQNAKPNVLPLNV